MSAIAGDLAKHSVLCFRDKHTVKLMESRGNRPWWREMTRVMCCNLGLFPHLVLEFLYSAVSHTLYTSGFSSGKEP